VAAWNVQGRLINCVVTQCGHSGIFSGILGLIELEGSQTKVDGNCTSGDSIDYGLDTYSTLHDTYIHTCTCMYTCTTHRPYMYCTYM